jgi:hypothetical protein
MILLKNLFRYCSNFGRKSLQGIPFWQHRKNVSNPPTCFLQGFLVFYLIQRYEPTTIKNPPRRMSSRAGSPFIPDKSNFSRNRGPSPRVFGFY